MKLQRANELLAETHALLRPSETGSIQEKRYYQAIQRDPDIALMHAELSDLLPTKP